MTNNGSDSISVIDRDGDAVQEVGVDVDPAAHEAPHHLAVDPTHQRLFVALAFPPDEQPTRKKDPHGAHGGASEPGKLARLELGNLAVRETRDVDENPGDVILSHDRKTVLVTHFDMKRAMDVASRGGGSPATMFASLAIFDAATMEKKGSRPVCVAPHGVATTRDDGVALVACYGSDELAIVDLKAPGFPVSRHPLGSAPGVPGVPRYGPYAVLLTPDERWAVLADLEGQDLRVFDRQQRKFLPDKTVNLSAKAFMPAFLDASRLLVPLQAPDGLAVVELQEARILTRVATDKAVCKAPHAARVAKDGRAYVVCEGDHRAPGSVVQVDPRTLSTIASWRVGVYPDGLVFGDD